MLRACSDAPDGTQLGCDPRGHLLQGGLAQGAHVRARHAAHVRVRRQQTCALQAHRKGSPLHYSYMCIVLIQVISLIERKFTELLRFLKDSLLSESATYVRYLINFTTGTRTVLVYFAC